MAEYNAKTSSLDEKDKHGEYLEEADPDAGLSDAERAAIDKKLVRKLDMRLIPWLCLLYLASFLDRTNIGNAKIEGLIHDLGMTNGQYNACLTIFFVSYALFEPISNILLKRIRPRIYIPLIMVLWGICMTFMGFCHNFSGMMAARWFLGLTEAGLFPGVNYYLSCWYKRREFGIRAAIFFSAAAVSGSFGGLLAAAISKMDGVGGKRGWAWIFILEGLATALIGVISFWVVVDFPDDAKFLSPEDRARVLRRLRDDQQSSAEHEDFKMLYLWQALKDWKTYTGMLIYMGVDGSLYAFSLFLPSIIKEMGYSATRAQLMSVPPYAAACILTILIGWWADRTNRRGFFNIATSLLGVVGFSILLGSNSAALSYVAVFLGALGIYPCIPNTITWVSNNVEGVYKRGVTLGFVIGWGNLNGVMSSNVYRQVDAPHYRLGHGVVLGYLAIGLLGGSVLNWLLLRRENEKRRGGERDVWVQGLDRKEIEYLGDRRPDFLYTL
ncbi:MFS general substrate transporter [Choiromyces venosus 120613-1]|uniref:MFS general substrate transporter n=1 Tax=Choiromyces venosus 120613-1 TaxID=1336337 RepID=A0A3N4JGM6_9PEZI|nr:MFS general substrate transporter [Choiromyces venosus 120613-1]